MINALHLLWIIPMTATIGLAAGILAASKQPDPQRRGHRANTDD